jgi:hypothetical protein
MQKNTNSHIFQKYEKVNWIPELKLRIIATWEVEMRRIMA